MMRRTTAHTLFAFVVLLSAVLLAQAPSPWLPGFTIAWDMGAAETDADVLTYQFSIDAAATAWPNDTSPTALTNVTCNMTAAPFPCTGQLPATFDLPDQTTFQLALRGVRSGVVGAWSATISAIRGSVPPPPTAGVSVAVLLPSGTTVLTCPNANPLCDGRPAGFVWVLVP